MARRGNALNAKLLYILDLIIDCLYTLTVSFEKVNEKPKLDAKVTSKPLLSGTRRI